jgi:hypothetical protein
MAKSSAKSNPKKTVGRYVDPVARGRVTKRRPAGADRSPHWYGWLILNLLIFGILIIALNYLSVLPGSTSAWYLALGLFTIFGAFFLATGYK